MKYSGLVDQNETLGDFVLDDVLKGIQREVYFTEPQQRYLRAKKVIKMCVDPEWMPFESIKNHQHIGITADVMAKFNQQLPIPIQLVETKSWTESIAFAKNRQCDIFSLAAKTPTRSQYMDFTRPYINLPIVLITKENQFFISNLEAVKHRKLGIVKGYAIAEELRNRIPDINIIDVESINDGLKRVESGELFGYIDNLMVVANAIQKDFTGVLKVSARLENNVQLAVGTRNDEPLLHDVFDLLVSHLKDEELQAIYNKWVAVKQQPVYDYSIAWKLLIALGLLAMGYLWHYTKLKKLNAKLLKLSTTDTLTGLSNRLKIDELLLQKKADFDRYGIECSMILFDIDFFKQVNDQLGHQAGDVVLIEFAHILQENIRASDFIGRWGGEEFLVICPHTDLQQAVSLAEKIRKKVEQHQFTRSLKITVSAGVSGFKQGASIDMTMKQVDQALYRSKENGRNQVNCAELSSKH